MVTGIVYVFSKFFITLFFLSINLNAHDSGLSREIEFPDIKSYKTLVCDLHMHSVFSDGSVWPDIRVKEAEKDGLDVIAVTEHIEYQPWKEDIPNPDRNRSFDYHKHFARNSDACRHRFLCMKKLSLFILISLLRSTFPKSSIIKHPVFGAVSII